MGKIEEICAGLESKGYSIRRDLMTASPRMVVYERNDRKGLGSVLLDERESRPASELVAVMDQKFAGMFR